jgi:hypothetical protein
MGKHILFVIHGIGVHGDDWAEAADGPVTTLKKIVADQGYEHFKTRKIEDRVDLHPITYDAVFQKVVKDWKDKIQGLPASDPPEIKERLLSWFGQADAEERNFWWTHVADLVLYRFFGFCRNEVRTHVLDRMAEPLEAAAKEGPPACSVLAHSMGTAVAHDCLHLLGTVRWGKRANPLSPRHWRFENVFMVANVSRLLQTSDAEMKPAYLSIVRPGPVEDPESYCGRYFNFRHEADPIPYPRMFDPAGWKGYQGVVVDHYRDYDVHGFSHHLISPRVHVPILRLTVHRRAVTEEEEIRAVNPDNFPRFGGKLQQGAAVEEFVSDLAKLRAGLGDDPDFAAWIEAIMEFRRVIKKLRAALAGGQA